MNWNGGSKTIDRQGTDSLSIAMFGRMFAFRPDLQHEAAVAVGHGTTTHEMSVEIDYFTAVDDINPNGAGHLGQAFYTSGVYYRAVTFDRAQLHRNWISAKNISDADRADLATAVTALINTVPTGKKTTTAAYTLPSLVIAEQQGARTNYHFQNPVTADDNGGYLDKSIERLLDQAADARSYDRKNFGNVVVAGTEADRFSTIVKKKLNAAPADLDGVVGGIVDWLLADA